MTDTAHPAPGAETDPNAQLQSAADAFLAFDNPPQPRDDAGRWAAKEQPEDEPETDDGEPETEEPEIDDGDLNDEDEHDEADEAHPMPPSWPADKAEQWSQLPAETQGFIAEREAERDRAVNAKFQESANARKAAEAAREEANANRTKYADELDVLLSLARSSKPDPRAFGAGTGQYNREAYDLALAQYEQENGIFAQLQEQRDAIRQQEEQESAAAFNAWKQETEAQYQPKLLADVPELTDGAKAEPLLRDLIGYAIESGIPEGVFAEDMQDQITSAQIHLIWKAKQFDKIRASKAQPKPKPASVAVRPGVSSPRSAQKAARKVKAHERLAREGSLEAAAEVFKDFM